MIHLPKLSLFLASERSYEKIADKPTKKSNYLVKLVDDLFFAIMEKFDVSDLIHLSLSCKKLSERVSSDRLFEPFLIKLQITHLKQTNNSCKKTVSSYCRELDYLAKKDTGLFILYKCIKPNSIENIKLLSEYLVARDKYMFLEKMQQNYSGKPTTIFCTRDRVVRQSVNISKFLNHNAGIVGYQVNLFLNRMALSTVPQEIISFHRLQALSLRNNYLKIFPAVINTLITLHYLDLTNNKLKMIPEELKSLTRLQTLKLGSNRLKNLPKCIMKLGKLQKLTVYNNPLNKTALSDLSHLNIKILVISKRQVSVALFEPTENNEKKIKLIK